MQHGLSRNQAGQAFRRLTEARRIFLIAFMLMGGSSALLSSSEAQPEPKSESKQAQAQRREYLPTLLQKILLENERAYVGSLTDFLKLYKALQESGGVSSLQVDQVEQELLQGRIRVLQRETDFRDALDQFKLRFDLAPERLQEVEESAVLPLTRHLQCFEDIFKDDAAVRAELRKNADPEKASKLRAFVRQSLTGSALVKDTRFSKQFAAQWGEWEKLKDVEEPLRKYRSEHLQLLDRRVDFELKEKPYPKADLQRLEEVHFQIDLGKLEQSLRTYESQPCKAEKDKNRRLSRHVVLFNNLQDAFAIVLQRALDDRIVRSRQTWPELPALQLEGVDLLTCDLEKAERLVASMSKKPPAAVAVKRNVRKARALAETYRLQQRLLELSHLQVQLTLEILVSPPAPGHVRQADGTAGLAQQLPKAQRSLAQVKAQLFSSWINYQIARLDVYRDVELTPP